MLRSHFMQQWFTLSDPAMEEALHDVPSSTKNASGERDREMHQSKKGNQWCFGMKTRIGVDAESGLVHTVRGTSGNVNDVVEGNALLHGQECEVFADAGQHARQGRAPVSGDQAPVSNCDVATQQAARIQDLAPPEVRRGVRRPDGRQGLTFRGLLAGSAPSMRAITLPFGILGLTNRILAMALASSGSTPSPRSMQKAASSG